MECYYLTITVLYCVTFCRGFLLIDDGKCGEGCFVRHRVLSNTLYCVCPSTQVTQDKRNHHHEHGHHHTPHPQETPYYVTHTPPHSTTSLCADGCQLELLPFHYCKCPLSTATTNVQSSTDTNINSEAQTMTENLVSTDHMDTTSTQDNLDQSTTFLPTTTTKITTKIPTTTKVPTTSLTTHKSTRLPSTIKTTQDICDILCAQQLGGIACHCSKPGLPG